MAKRIDEQNHWHRLDNTANIFPVTTSKNESNVFRLSMTLIAPVAPELLQQALEMMLPRFPGFAVLLRRGAFWFYLNENNAVPTIREESDYPCRAINPAQNNDFLFRVTYYDKRINVEIFHVLTDGTGGVQFLRALCCQYLMLAYPTRFTEEEKAKHWYEQHVAETNDGYVSNYRPTKKTSFSIGKGYRIRGERLLLDTLSVVHTYIPLQPLLALCRGKGVTITQYVTACIAWGVYTTQLRKRPSKHPLNMYLPINLRKLFGTNTALNFFSNIYISLDMQADDLHFNEILAEVKKQFEEKISRGNMLEKISYTVGSGYNPAVRFVPLPLKNLALRIMFKQGAKSSSLAFSNVGDMSLPAPFAQYVTGASFLLSCVPREPIKFAACSANGLFTLSFASMLRSQEIQQAIVQKMAEDGLEVTIETNGVDYESV
ncbi:MAG: hypothetical protein GXY32_04710 [Ruminococcaceae bacterium]|nr:hypothetical protein [Oscillospiraceae bacterium]